MRPSALFAIVAAAAGLVACDDSTVSPPGVLASVEIEAADSVLPVGGTLAFTAVAYDDEGEPADVEIQLESTDAGVAAIQGSALEGLAIGYTDVIARVGDRADTLRVRVRDDAVSPASVRVRYGRGGAAPTSTHSIFMRFIDRMGEGTGDEAGLFVQPSGSGRDSAITIVIPGEVHGGRQPLTAFRLDGSDPHGVTAILRFGTAATGDLEYYVSVDTGWIELTIQDPPAPGWRTGSATGFFHMPLVKIAPGNGGPPVLTSDTLWVHGAVRSSYQHVLLGWSSIATLDGPVVGSSVLGQAFVGDDDVGGWFVGLYGDFDGLGSGPGRWEVSQELRVLGPSVGSFAFPRFTGDAFGDPALWPTIFSSIFYRDDARIPLVVDGTLTITRWLPPTLEDYGVIEGTIDARFELWTADLTAPTGDTIRALSEFAAPVSPEVGLPAVPPAPAQFRPRR